MTLITERTSALQTQPAMREDFMKEMRRFLPAVTVRDTIEKEAYWSYLADLVEELGRKAIAALR